MSLKIILIMLFSIVLISKEPSKNNVILKKPKKEIVSLHKIDWYNYEYIPGWMTLKGGNGEIHEYAEMGKPHDTTIWKLEKICYGDVNNDKIEDAVIIVDVMQDNYQAKKFYKYKEEHIYTVKDNKITKLNIKDSYKIDLSKLKCESKKSL